MPSPYAVQNFLATATTAWTLPPRWVLLVGDASGDPRDYQGLGQVNYVPVPLVATAELETASDDWYGDVDGDGIPELAMVGRLPVHAASDATALVTKIVAYDATASAPWKTKALLVAGTNDKENDFEAYTAAVEALLPSRMTTVTTIKQGSTPNPAGALLDQLALGQGLVNFTGHGSVEVWQGGLFSSTAAEGATYGGATPFVIAMTCLNGYFADVWTYSLAEALLQPLTGGGAVGVWASSGLTEAAPQAVMNQAMITALYGGAPLTVGEAARIAKQAVADLDVRRTWILFGDPSMRIR
jgi:gingipain R